MSCASGYHDYQTLHVTELPFEDVWSICVEEVVQSGFELDPTQLDRRQGKLVTKWNASPGPFGKGERTRLQLEVDKIDPKTFNVRFFIEQQKNKNLRHAFHPREEDWSSSGQYALAETTLAHQLQSSVAQRKGIQLPSVKGVQYEEPLRGVKRN